MEKACDFKVCALEIMKNICENDELEEDLDLDLFEAGLIDSLSTISIILEIEKRFGVKLQPTDFERKDIASVNNFEIFLERKCI